MGLPGKLLGNTNRFTLRRNKGGGVKLQNAKVSTLARRSGIFRKADDLECTDKDIGKMVSFTTTTIRIFEKGESVSNTSMDWRETIEGVEVYSVSDFETRKYARLYLVKYLNLEGKERRKCRPSLFIPNLVHQILGH